MNVITMTGYVGADPAIDTFQDSGNAKAKLRISTKRRSGNTRNGQVTDWHNVICTVTDVVQNLIEPHIQKGALVSITGELIYESFEKNGQTVKLPQIIVSDRRGIELLQAARPKSDSNEADQDGDATAEDDLASAEQQAA
ncbi:single-stranded DNA-binding protein [Microvirga tunisiensis]|uniref:Single-stranded DNA-binding protein n=1 Tax=Microvirga tunisiensis TaxID=2108360 RepID=A0A5N7MCP7_9HYPH|nr:single-stranded DNA-binding protein [Microvirga tunisiensis]MPR05674.1 single-stranded DNA-binding protein [Microvirga tunisiensis]MPR23874.1 single-stranded DNA-binding protein [Microvirga tunisiensis]